MHRREKMKLLLSKCRNKATLIVYQHANYLAVKIHEQEIFSGIKDNYTLEHLCNILVITCILGFASNLGDNQDIAIMLGYNLHICICG